MKFLNGVLNIVFYFLNFWVCGSVFIFESLNSSYFLLTFIYPLIVKFIFLKINKKIYYAFTLITFLFVFIAGIGFDAYINESFDDDRSIEKKLSKNRPIVLPDAEDLNVMKNIFEGVAGVSLDEVENELDNYVKENKKDAIKEFKLGMDYFSNNNSKKSVYWLTKSAKKMYLPAYKKLIIMYLEGTLVERNLIIAGAFNDMLPLMIKNKADHNFYVNTFDYIEKELKIDGFGGSYPPINKMANQIFDDDEWCGE